MLKKKKIICVHSILLILNIFLFAEKICVSVGSENIAYGIPVFGSNLQEDYISRILCFSYAFVFAICIVTILWNGLFYILSKLKSKNIVYWCMLLVLAIGIVVILFLYPQMYGQETNDDYMNYVYAKEFLPMYWHGFFTNVVYCAVSIVFFHPISIPIFQYICGITSIFYLLDSLLPIVKAIRQKLILVVLVFVMLMIPEMQRILLCPTRNCMYAIVSLWAFILLAVDYIKRNDLKRSKFVILCILFAILGTWRGEGVVYAVFFPVLIYAVYNHDRKLHILENWKKVLKMIVFFCIVFIFLSLPDKYGGKKYFNKDYMITNTTGPLSAVLHDNNANLDYEGAQKDWENIEKIIPLEMIYKYGCNSSAANNAMTGRWIIQTGSNKEDGERYIKSAYRILLYNLPIYLKYEINYFLDANLLLTGIRFRVDFGKQWLDDYVLAKDGYIRLYEFFDAGKKEFISKGFTIINEHVDISVKNTIKSILDSWYTNGRNIFSWFKIGILVMQLITLFLSIYRRQWFYTMVTLANLCVLCIIVLVAPWARPNYYYTIFLNMYCCISYFVFQGLTSGKMQKV